MSTEAGSAGVHREALVRRLDHIAATLNLPMSPLQTKQLVDFVELLLHWNRTYNLTAVRDPQAAMTQHIADCLAAVGPLRRHLETFSVSTRCLDVGSGAGLPGLVFAVMQPGIAVTCIDTVGKKAAFVRHAASALGIGNLESSHGRVEQWRGGTFDLVCSRAFATLSTFTSLTIKLLGEDGVWLAMKGKLPRDEVATLSANIEVFHVEPLRVPDLEAERCLIWMRSTKSGV